MSFQAMAWAVEQKLPTREKFVLLMLANRTNHDTGRCDPSHKRLAEDCGMSQSTVKRAIQQLEEDGYLVVENRSVEGVKIPNQYLLLLDRGVGSHRPYPVHSEPRVGSHRPEGSGHTDLRVGSHRPIKQELNLEGKPEEIGASAKTKDLVGVKEMISTVPGLSEQVAKDFLKIRKAKRAPLTQTAWSRILAVLAEAETKGCKPESALGEAVERCWQTVKIEWLVNAGLLSSAQVVPFRAKGGPLQPGFFYHPDDNGLAPEKRRVLSSETHDPCTGYTLEYMRKRGLL
ncbi:hypothetical protein C1Y35_19865 [Pseudomonas sp. GW456-L14]|uniref:helix-turn-helix domain-containing protein n=1 Tax=unclassified Pseudomonas TaxID=196821 RepID=UPI000C889D7F|nr:MULTISPECIES: helix-turn-helix domain-containing protein [unclassified Pseudomonas]PMY37344.1 hypothetical protein C1Y35_19865 [Pseudomonas sp. GW456-L14]PMY59339.1 hypothetical protein C1Y34_02105 [Pseudomonas sp. GW456-L12]